MVSRAVVCISVLCTLLVFSTGLAKEPNRLDDSADSLYVFGVLEVPPGTGPFPAVVLLHGAGGWDERYVRLAKMFANYGFVTLALDYYANTGSSPIGSAAKLVRWPYYQRAVRHAVEYLHTLPSVSDRLVGLVGFSRGAFLAVSVAGSMPSVAAVVDLYGGGGGGTQPLEKDVLGLPALLILHGGSDSVVPVSYAYDLRDAVIGVGGEVEVHIYPDEDHVLSEASMMDALLRAVEFLRRHLEAR